MVLSRQKKSVVSLIHNMELLIAAALGGIGYTLSRNTPSTTPFSTNGQQSRSIAVDRPASYPFESVPNSIAALREHERLSQERWEQARKAAVTGVVSGSMYRTEQAAGWRNVIKPRENDTPTPSAAAAAATNSASATPYFSSFAAQHTNDVLKQRLMEAASGTDSSAWKPKTESASLFAPVPQQITSSGSAGNTPNYETTDRRANAVSGLQNNALPFSQVMVGPGVGLKDINTPASDGFHSRFRVLPPDAYSYKKNNLEGRVIPGAALNQAPAVNPKVVSKGVPRYYDMRRRPLEKGRAAVTGQALRPEIVRTGGCAAASSEYYGIAGANSGAHVALGSSARYKSDRNEGVHLTNATGARAGVGAYHQQSYDDARMVSQQRETSFEPGQGVVTGDHKRYSATSNFLVPSTQRALNEQGYLGGAKHYVPTAETRPQDSLQPTLREQLHPLTNGPGGAAPVTTGPTVQCTNKQLLREAKRGSQVVNTYVAAPERTSEFRKANLGDDLLSERWGCGINISVKSDDTKGRVTSHASSQALYMNQASAGTSTTDNRNKLATENRFQDYSIAKTVLKDNDLIPKHQSMENVNIAFMR